MPPLRRLRNNLQESLHPSRRRQRPHLLPRGQHPPPEAQHPLQGIVGRVGMPGVVAEDNVAGVPVEIGHSVLMKNPMMV
jgi:hypothetical protein